MNVITFWELDGYVDEETNEHFFTVTPHPVNLTPPPTTLETPIPAAWILFVCALALLIGAKK